MPNSSKWIDKANLSRFWDSIKHRFTIYEQQTTELMSKEADFEVSVTQSLPSIASNALDEKFGEDIGDNVSSWLTEHVDPVGSAVVVDDTLSISGAAADAKVTGDRIGELNADLTQYNTYDIFVGKLTKTTGAHNGVTYTWSGDVCTVTGGTTSSASVNILRTSTDIPTDVVPGSTYYLRYRTTDTNVELRIIFRKSDNSDINPYHYYQTDGTITVPSNAAKWTVALYVASGKTFITPAIVSEVKLISAKTNAELTDDVKGLQTSLIQKGIVATGVDVDDIRTPGYYMLNSSYTYAHSPFSENEGGVLVVFPATNNTILQIANNAWGDKLLYRSSFLGTFPSTWNKASKDITIERIYQNYNNEYTINCSPSITTDTNNYLASTGDTTDRTGDIQTMLNTTGVCRLGPGVFYVTGISIPSFGMLSGSGASTQLILSSSVTVGYAVELGNYSCVKNIRIVGSTSNYTVTGTVGTRHGILFEATADAQSPTRAFRAIIDDCHITDFSGGAITCYNTGQDPGNSIECTNVFILRCEAGVNVSYLSEFHRFTNVMAHNCYYGCICNGGNCNFVNCDFSVNVQGLLIDNSVGQSQNNSHGTFSACTFNHSGNNAGKAIEILGASAGEVFSGCQIFYGSINIDESVGIRFDGANIGKSVPINVTDSTVVIFSNCTMYSAAESPVTQSGNTAIAFKDCYSRSGVSFDPI